MESPLLYGLLYVILLFTLLSARMWIATTLGLVGIVGLTFVVGGGAVSMIGPLQFNSTNLFVYTMIPLFIFMGELFSQGRFGDRLYEGATEWVGFLPGGLLHANVVACALFAAISGSSMATAATIGSVAIEELEKRQYDRRLLYGSLAAGGTLGILIPPSLSMVIYGAFVGESIAQLFIGGIVPGILLTLLFMLYIACVSIVRPHLIPDRIRMSPRRMARALLDMWPAGLVFFMVLGTIYVGIATPTEAAALGAGTTFILCAAFGRLTWKGLTAALTSALEVSCFLMFIIISASILSMALSMSGIPKAMALLVGSLQLDAYTYWALLIVVYLILGCFIDGVSMMLLTIPVVYPVMMNFGFGSVWFGIALTICIEMGQITPPVGVNLFVLDGLTGKKHYRDVILGSLPFVVLELLGLIIITIFPALVTWLPGFIIQRF
jgi:tripartite ATP-independent transporter DctM subunit